MYENPYSLTLGYIIEKDVKYDEKMDLIDFQNQIIKSFTGKNKDVYVIKFLNKKIPLLSYKKYKNFKVETNNIIENNILPISISKEKQHEVILKEEIYTWEEAISNAIELSKKKLLENNSKIINIKKVEILDKQTIDSKIKLNLFISVEEDITKIVEVKKEEEKDLQS